MKRVLTACLALSLFGVVSTGCDHCMLHKETTGTTSEAKTADTENQSVEASEKTPEPAAP